MILWFLTHNIVASFQCIPVRKTWEMWLPGKCIDTLKFVIGTHSANLILDLIILVLPIAAVWRLHMATMSKIRVAGIFLLGGLYV